MKLTNFEYKFQKLRSQLKLLNLSQLLLWIPFFKIIYPSSTELKISLLSRSNLWSRNFKKNKVSYLNQI